MKELAITSLNSITAIGHDGPMTAASVRAGISRFYEYDDFPDGSDNPITVARIRGIMDSRDTIGRMDEIAVLCLDNLLAGYFKDDSRRPGQIRLFLGAASEERPGPRYEESCMGSLSGIMEKWADKSSIETVPLGNASMQNAVARAGELIESDSNTLCIIGGIDSLLRDSTLSWFEKDGRLKSISYGRHQGLIAGEAACFMFVEDPALARQLNRPILARITGLGLAEEPNQRTSNPSNRSKGLTEACRTALAGTSDNAVCTVFGDLNGENSRAMEWCIAERRCFQKKDEQHRQLWTPANCYGDIGAASGAVLTAVAAQGLVRGWIKSPALVFCSDDHGPCGALILENG